MQCRKSDLQLRQICCSTTCNCGVWRTCKLLCLTVRSCASHLGACRFLAVLTVLKINPCPSKESEFLLSKGTMKSLKRKAAELEEASNKPTSSTSHQSTQPTQKKARPSQRKRRRRSGPRHVETESVSAGNGLKQAGVSPGVPSVSEQLRFETCQPARFIDSCESSRVQT